MGVESENEIKEDENRRRAIDGRPRVVAMAIYFWWTAASMCGREYLGIQKPLVGSA